MNKEYALLEDGTYEWIESDSPVDSPILSQPDYEQLVEQLIREKYSVSQELAILRQRDAKPTEWQVYYDFAESCKTKAREVTETALETI